MKLAKKFLFVAGATLLLSTTGILASSQANTIISKAFKYVGSLDKYSLDAIVINDDMRDGKSIKYKHNVAIKVDRPDKFRVDIKGDIKDRSSYLNSGLFTMIDYGFGYYGELKTANNIDRVLDDIFERYGIKAPLAQLLYSDMHKRTKLRRSRYFGVATLGGVECDYVAFADRKKEVHVWIATGDQPLVKCFIVIDKLGRGNPRSVTTIKWNLDTTISDNDFIFKLPKGVTKISIESAN
ncbi:MAG: DUF2092 domain-containing protein [Campylobacterota bacterium]|nr:DUF2092 domain-containing protein [Campylobacterota bacterium]